jgi:short-subunit dehydrogenase
MTETPDTTPLTTPDASTSASTETSTGTSTGTSTPTSTLGESSLTGATPGRPFALVTGASSGIGLELAGQLAEEGHDLLVVAEDDGLTIAADALRGRGADVLEVKADLRTGAGVDAVWTAVTGSGRSLDVVALNAGIGLGGPFLETDITDEISIIDLNVVANIRLAKLVLRSMVARGSGKVLVTSSIASSMPGTYQSVYNGSKSFLQSFAEALQEELKDTGVTITILMPGPTETNFFARAGMLATNVGRGKKDDALLVAKQGLQALKDGKAKIVAGSVMTKLQGAANTVLPDAVKAKAHRKMAEPSSE